MTIAARPRVRQEKERDRRRVDLSALEALAGSSAVTVTMAGLNSMRVDRIEVALDAAKISANGWP